MKNLGLVLLYICLISSCKKKAIDPSEVAGSNSVAIRFEHFFGAAPMSLNASAYCITANTDSLKFTTLKYYISNIKLKRTNGTYWTQSDSYYLIDRSNAGSMVISIPDVPVDTYSEMVFTIGVDSTHNVSGAQTGALSPANNMFWSWSTGYIFFKSEGSFQNGTSKSGSFVYDISGFQNSNNTNAIQLDTISFSTENLSVTKSVSPEVHLRVDVSKAFNGGPYPVDVYATPSISSVGTSAVHFSQNYKEMFQLDHVHQ